MIGYSNAFVGQKLLSNKPQGVQQRQNFDRPNIQNQKPKPTIAPKQSPSSNNLERPNQMGNQGQPVDQNQDPPKSKLQFLQCW